MSPAHPPADATEREEDLDVADNAKMPVPGRRHPTPPAPDETPAVDHGPVKWFP